jgi:ABC-type amino acid transport substrate-binding protein
LADALTSLDAGEVEAVVYDAPLLRYRVRNDFPRLDVVPTTFERQDYALAMPSGSPIREQVNRAVLHAISRRSWEETLTDYFGER